MLALWAFRKLELGTTTRARRGTASARRADATPRRRRAPRHARHALVLSHPRSAAAMSPIESAHARCGRWAPVRQRRGAPERGDEFVRAAVRGRPLAIDGARVPDLTGVPCGGALLRFMEPRAVFASRRPCGDEVALRPMGETGLARSHFLARPGVPPGRRARCRQPVGCFEKGAPSVHKRAIG